MTIFSKHKYFDPYNIPNIVQLIGSDFTNIELPHDVIIYLNGEKVIATSKILDGVAVYEKILRNPCEIKFEFTIRQTQAQDQNRQDYSVYNLPSKDFVFPQKVAQNYFNQIWLPDSILSVTNTYLNGLGIFELIIKSIDMQGVRGSTNLPCIINCLENFKSNNENDTSLIKI